MRVLFFLGVVLLVPAVFAQQCPNPDNVAPTIICYSQSSFTSPGLCGAVVYYQEPDVFDLCGASIQKNGAASSGDFFNVGITSIGYTARDPSNNLSSCTTSVTVVDIEPPVVTGCPDDIIVTTNNVCSATVSWTEATVATDNCGVTSLGQSHTPGSVFNSGVTVVSYSARDAAGNTGSCAFTVTVQESGSVLYSNCPSDITVDSSCSDSGTAVSWTEPTVTATCLSYSSRNFAPGSRFPDGVTTVYYVAVEDQGSDVCLFHVIVNPCPAEGGANRPPGAVGSIDLDGDGYFSDAPLLEWRDCCDSPEDQCDDPFLVNPGAFEIAHNDQQDSCRGISATADADAHIAGCDRDFISSQDFTLVGPTIPSSETNQVIYALDMCEFQTDDDDPSWGFDEQQSMVFTLANTTRNGYDIGIFGPSSAQASIINSYGGILPVRGDFMLAISSGTARDQVTGGHSSPAGFATGNTAVNLPATFLDAGVAGFIEDCATTPYAIALDSIRAHFAMRQPTNMNAFSFQALYMDFELEANQGSYPALNGMCLPGRQSWFLAIKYNSLTGLSPSGNFAGDNTGRSFNSFNANPGFWSQCDDYGDISSGFCRDGSTDLEFTGYTGASNWIPIGTSALPGENFDLEFVTFDGQDSSADVTVLIDDFFPITEARTAGSQSWARNPYGYQFEADLQLVNFGVTSGMNILSRTATSVSFDFMVRNWGPEEANDITISFTPPLGTSFASIKDSNGSNLSCVTFPMAAPYQDNSLHKCKFRQNDPLLNQATRSGTVAFNINLGCTACPTHTEQLRFRLTATLSSIDRELGNNYLTTNIIFE